MRECCMSVFWRECRGGRSLSCSPDSTLLVLHSSCGVSSLTVPIGCKDDILTLFSIIYNAELQKPRLILRSILYNRYFVLYIFVEYRSLIFLQRITSIWKRKYSILPYSMISVFFQQKSVALSSVFCLLINVTYLL